MGSFLIFVSLFIGAMFWAMIKGAIVYSTGKHAKALTPSFLKSFGCFLLCYLAAIVYIFITGSLELKGFLMVVGTDIALYVLVSIVLIKPYGVTGVKNIISFVVGGLFSNLLVMVLFSILFGMLIHLGVLNILNAVMV